MNRYRAHLLQADETKGGVWDYIFWRLLLREAHQKRSNTRERALYLEVTVRGNRGPDRVPCPRSGLQYTSPALQTHAHHERSGIHTPRARDRPQHHRQKANNNPTCPLTSTSWRLRGSRGGGGWKPSTRSPSFRKRALGCSPDKSQTSMGSCCYSRQSIDIPVSPVGTT